MFICRSKSKKSSNQQFQNQNYLRLRLTIPEKQYYTNLFLQFKDPKTGHVLIENFPKLLGILGTDIAEDIAQRIFEIFSGNKNYITVQEYLKYIDVYHYGDKNERSNLTCKLMDFNNDGQITFNEFYKYINLIIGAVRKVNPYLKSELFSKDDIKVLFNKISNNKEYFTYDDFFIVYNEKPEIISWIDYFKNDSDDSLLIFHKYIKKIIRNFFKFSKDIINLFKNSRKKNFENEKNGEEEWTQLQSLVNDIKQLIDDFSKEMEKQNNKFMNFAKNNEISLRNLLSILSQNGQDYFEEDKNDESSILINNNINNNDEKNILRSPNKNPSLKLYNTIGAIKDSKNIINENKPKNAMLRKSVKMETTLQNFFYDLKKNLNSDLNINNKRRVQKSQSICGKNLIFKNKLLDKEININKISPFNIEEKNINNTDNNKKDDDSSGYTDFIISEEDDEGISGKNINILNHEAFFMLKYSQKKDNSNNNFKSKIINEIEENKKILEESTKTKTFKESNGLLVDKSNSIKIEVQEKNTEKYKPIVYSLLNHFKNFSVIFFKSMININDSYKYVESKYLKKEIINIQRIKKEEVKNTLINKIKAQNKEKNSKSQQKNLVSTAVKNIPKTKLKTSDDSFKILLNTIMGIQIAVESSPDIAEVQNIDQYLHSMTYSIQTSNISKNKHESFMIKEYAGIVFNNIRRLYNYDKESLIQSISPQVFITDIIISNTTSIEEFFNTGSSGSLFYYTRDGKFILKTIDKKEYKTLKRILPKYFKHLVKYKYTFLPKFFGYYKLIRKVKKKKTNFYFIIMMNVFSTKKKIHLRFDLKGSKLGRRVLKQKEIANLNYGNILGKYNYALKDQDFDYFKKEIHIRSNVREKIIEQLTIDSLLLKEFNLNDYSLLLGIHKKKIKKKINVDNSLNKENEENNNVINTDNNYDINTENMGSNISNYSFSLKEKESQKDRNSNTKSIKDDFSSERMTITSLNKSFVKNNSEENYIKSEIKEIPKEEIDNFINENKDIILEDGGFLNEKENEIYYMGIIDILTNYDCIKVGEFVYKSIRYCSKKMSCISPASYQERFMGYLKQIIPPNYDKDDKKDEKLKIE